MVYKNENLFLFFSKYSNFNFIYDNIHKKYDPNKI